MSPGILSVRASYAVLSRESVKQISTKSIANPINNYRALAPSGSLQSQLFLRHSTGNPLILHAPHRNS
ncbi:38473ecd-dc96-4072-962e-946d43612baa [Sclerotinia trifoliorum]|uniref:38473ecd-dc96-4072-962e-946d43612baa n=1 Tax=Sclerotinia trifoliorum TaxID=28548 RepID=A0A8H2ZLW7_9HELO|nr:38473ecd-dc96-4072-962e-946d43612baa [Sclerotinia trifoliorum]